MTTLLTIKEASQWASQRFNRRITPANIGYLIQYGRIEKTGANGGVRVRRRELEEYYNDLLRDKTLRWRESLGADLNWRLSFSEFREAETTKHVHRLHPYKGKFIPQLVAYFLDSHTDEFKREAFFRPGDIVLDPFCGSGTTLAQANELGIHAVGVDVSGFNAYIANAKLGEYDLPRVARAAAAIDGELREFQSRNSNIAFEAALAEKLAAFNARYFPSPQFKRSVRQKEVDEARYGAEKAAEFLPEYRRLERRFNMSSRPPAEGSFLDRWYLPPARAEIDFLFERIKAVRDAGTKKLLGLVLSRTMRTCRATTHADLGTLKSPVDATYYCKKHGKMCKPLFSAGSWWRRYVDDTISRLREFSALRTDAEQHCLTGDSRTVDIVGGLAKKRPALAELCRRRGIAGVFASPPYVGLIDYHAQHAYAYDLFGFARADELEIGPLRQGQGRRAKDAYAQGIVETLRNCRRFMRRDYHVFLVVNDKHDMYPAIAEGAGMEIVNSHKRPVLNRTEKNRHAYAEMIFHMREKGQRKGRLGGNWAINSRRSPPVAMTTSDAD